MAAAFFTSLERCSCINIETKDDPEESGDQDDDKDDECSVDIEIRETHETESKDETSKLLVTE